MWVYDIDTLEFLDVNEAAQKHYGYTEAEFKQMTLKDIRPAQDMPAFEEQLKIATFLSAIDDKINHTLKQIEKAEGWKKGLMQQMFC